MKVQQNWMTCRGLNWSSEFTPLLPCQPPITYWIWFHTLHGASTLGPLHACRYELGMCGTWKERRGPTNPLFYLLYVYLLLLHVVLVPVTRPKCPTRLFMFAVCFFCRSSPGTLYNFNLYCWWLHHSPVGDRWTEHLVFPPQHSCRYM